MLICHMTKEQFGNADLTKEETLLELEARISNSFVSYWSPTHRILADKLRLLLQMRKEYNAMFAVIESGSVTGEILYALTLNSDARSALQRLGSDFLGPTFYTFVTTLPTFELPQTERNNVKVYHEVCMRYHRLLNSRTRELACAIREICLLYMN